jgi:hypothetical protein
MVRDTDSHYGAAGGLWRPASQRGADKRAGRVGDRQHAVRFGVSSARGADAKLTKTIERGMTAWLKTLT